MLWLDIFDTNVANTNELIGSDPEGNKLQQIMLRYFRTYLNVFSLIILPFYSLASKWVFKKYKLYYAEHLVIHGYLFAQYTLLQMITYVLFSAFPGLLKFSMVFDASCIRGFRLLLYLCIKRGFQNKVLQITAGCNDYIYPWVCSVHDFSPSGYDNCCRHSQIDWL
jgi:hypothetical protein